MRQIINNESGSNPYAINKSSGACGIPQALPCSKLLNKIGSLENIAGQVQWMIDYVSDRYTTPKNALYFWQVVAPTYDFNNDGRPDGQHWY